MNATVPETKTFYVISTPQGYWGWTLDWRFRTDYASYEYASQFETKEDAVDCIKRYWCRSDPEPKVIKITVSVVVEQVQV